MKGLKDQNVTSNPPLTHSHALLSPFLLPVSVLKLDFPPFLPVGHQTAIGTPPWSSDGRTADVWFSSSPENRKWARVVSAQAGWA